MMVKRKLDGAVDESSANREIHKSDETEHTLGKCGGLHLAELGLTAGWQSSRQNFCEASNFKSLLYIEIFNFPLCLAKVLQ